MILVQLLILLMLMVIFVQDLQSRSVYWVIFPILTALLLTLRLNVQLFSEAIRSIGITLGFLIFQMTLLTLYFSIKQRRWLNLTRGWLGWGDLLFLVSIAFYLSFLNFMLFYISSLIVILTCWVIWQAILKNPDSRIPLAGMEALLLAIVLMLDWWVLHWHTYTDDWLYFRMRLF